MSVSKKLIATIFPRYSLVLDQVNHNAKLGEWIKKHAAVPQFSGREKMYAFLNERHLGARPMDFTRAPPSCLRQAPAHRRITRAGCRRSPRS